MAAVIGLTFHSFAYLTKVYAESMEEVDEGTIEALRASGAGFWQIVFQAVLPASIELALKECEKELLQLGITTIYHSFSLYSDELLGKSPLRTKESVLEMEELVADIQNRSQYISNR